MSKLEIAYVAGIIDGEGCIGFRYINKYYLNVYIQVNMTHQVLVNNLFEQFNGNVHTQIKNNIKHKTTYMWCASNDSALKVITKIYPFLIIKKAQAKLAMQFYSLDVKTDAEINEFFKEQMHKLNKRGN